MNCSTSIATIQSSIDERAFGCTSQYFIRVSLPRMSNCGSYYTFNFPKWEIFFFLPQRLKLLL
nr:MAG TPA: hypothetical protein [Caudoviricetes sp.]